jgi:hypothetical protein
MAKSAWSENRRTTVLLPCNDQSIAPSTLAIGAKLDRSGWKP